MSTRRQNTRRSYPNTADAALAQFFPSATPAQRDALKEALRGSRGHAGTPGPQGATGAGGTGVTTDKGCRIYHSANQNINTDADTALTFDSERWDTDTMHSAGVNPSRITFTTAGRYAVSATVRWELDVLHERETTIRLNNTLDIAFVKETTIATEELEQTIATIYTFAANDYIQVMVNQNSGSTLAIQAILNASPEFAAQLLVVP